MKNLYVFFLLLATTIAVAQCPTGTITLSSQAEVNAFAASYPDCTTIDGDLVISGADITDLTPLNQITTVSSSLAVYLCPAISNLNGLQALTSVGSLNIVSNDILNDISALFNLTTVTQAISFSNCPLLLSLEGLQGITASGGLGIINMPIATLNGLENLASIGGSFEIKYCSNLTNLSALANVNNIDGYIYLLNLPLLNDITGLETFNISTLTSISIVNCPNLSFCSIASFCTFLTTIGSGTFTNNGTGCNGGEVVAGCNLGTNDFSAESLSLSPNPANNTVKINLKSNDIAITITDVSGKIVFFSPRLQTETINIETLESGVYFVMAQTYERRFHSKLIKK